MCCLLYSILILCHIARVDYEYKDFILAFSQYFYFQGYAGGASPGGPMPPPGSGGGMYTGGPPTSRPSGPPNASVPPSGPPGQPPMPSRGPGPMYPGK